MTYRIINTKAGFVGIVFGEKGLNRVYLPQPSAAKARQSIEREFPEADEDRELQQQLAQDIEHYFAGQPVKFRAPLDWGGHGEFEISVWKACAGIGFGHTLTYKALAEKVGKPRAARAVGMAMSRNPFPIVVPCHRVLKSDGSLGGYSGPGGVDFKRDLLEMEHAAVN